MADRAGLDDNEALNALIDLWRDGQEDLDARLADVWRQIRAAKSAGTDEAIVNRLRAQGARLAALGDVSEAILDDLIQGTDDWLQLSAGRAAVGGMSTVYVPGAEVAAQATGLPFAFTMPHRAAVEVLAQDTFNDVLARTRHIERDDKRWIRRVSRRLNGLQLTGGRTAVEQARRLERELASEFRRRGIGAITYADGSRHGFGEYAEMLLRTKSSQAYNQGTINHSRQAGIQFMEILDGADCGLVSHRDPQLANGLIVPMAIASAFPLAHPNAFMGGQSFVPIGACREVVRARYSGPSVSIGTAELPDTTVSPEHPILTGRGWIPARELSPGDHVLSYSRGVERHVTGMYFDQENTMGADDRFSSLAKSGRHTRVVAAADDLHGAAKFSDPKVDVVDTERLLMSNLQPVGFKGTRNTPLGASGLSDVLLRLGAPEFGGQGVPLPSPSPMSPSDRFRAFGVGHPGPPELHRLTARWHPVTSVSHGYYRGLVYDASTADEAYTVNGIVVANCRRALAPRPDVTASTLATAPSVQSIEARNDQAAFERALAAEQAERSRRRRRRARRARRPRRT